MSSTAVSDRLSGWALVLCRVVAVTLTAYPAARKFLEYSDRVAQFREWGVPVPELAVPLSGVIEIVAIISLALGVAGRFGAVALGATMMVALVTAGPNPFIGLVLASAAVIAVFGTGPYSYWDPGVADLVSHVDTVSGETTGGT